MPAFAKARGTGEIIVGIRNMESIGAGWGQWEVFGRPGEVRTQPGAPVTAVLSPTDERLDVFCTSVEGAALTTYRTAGSDWQKWLELDKPVLSPGAEISAVWRGPHGDHLDVFAVAADGTVVTAYWEPGIGWQPWVPIHRGTKAFPRGAVTAVWQEGGDTHLDLFTTGLDGTVLTTFWTRDKGWEPWAPVQGRTKVAQGATITAVWRPGPPHLDLFASAADESVQSTYWEPGIGWHSWFPVGKEAGVATAGAAVAAVWRTPEHLDLLTIGRRREIPRPESTVRSATWQPASGWQPWYDVHPGETVRPPVGGKATITAGRSGDMRFTDALMVTRDGNMATMYIEDGTDWHEWYVVPEPWLHPGAPVAAVWLDATRVDVFVSGIAGAVLTNRWTSSDG
jgi:hypothetical protein